MIFTPHFQSIKGLGKKYSCAVCCPVQNCFAANVDYRWTPNIKLFYCCLKPFFTLFLSVSHTLYSSLNISRTSIVIETLCIRSKMLHVKKCSLLKFVVPNEFDDENQAHFNNELKSLIVLLLKVDWFWPVFRCYVVYLACCFRLYIMSMPKIFNVLRICWRPLLAIRY